MAVLAVIVGTPAAVACGSKTNERPSFGRDLTLEEARTFQEFPLVYAGERVDGLPLVAIVRRNDTADFVSFVYGDCRPSTVDGGCAPPAEIQVWPNDRRNAGSYAASPGPPASERATIRGSPAAFFHDGTRLELYIPRVTVIVFGRSRARSEAIAGALRCVTDAGPRSPGESLIC